MERYWKLLERHWKITMVSHFKDFKETGKKTRKTLQRHWKETRKKTRKTL